MNDVLITGGAGFIGTALANRLKSLGYTVSLIDLPEKFKIHHKENFDCFNIDIRNFSNFSSLGNRSFNYIFHLAAQTSGAISQEQPELDVDTNVKGTLNICNFARLCRVEKIIFSSSMAAYGDIEGKISESDLLIPRSNYGVSKVSGELYIKMFKQFDLKYTIFRLFNVYGPGQDMSNLRQGMASIFMAQSILGNEIKVTGSFDRYRDFVYIDDVVEALIMGMDEKLDNDIFNVGSEQKTTVKSLINMIIDINDKDTNLFKIINIGKHEGDIFGSVANSYKLKSLGWSAKMSLRDGMRNMYTYAKEVLL